MPLQNRVDPWGKLQAVPMRGSFMGNRGILHNESRRIVRPWAGKSWVTCVRQFNGIQRAVFDKGAYSELFFGRGNGVCSRTPSVQLLSQGKVFGIQIGLVAR